MTGNLTLSKTSATCTSTWTRTAHQATAVEVVYTYSTPTWDYDNITISVPAAIAAGQVNSVKFTYTGASASGSKSIKFSDTRETFSNSALLKRIKAGETKFTLLFSFKATGGTDALSSTCYWQNISCSVDYTPASVVGGNITVGSSSVYYGLKQKTVASGEYIKFNTFVVTASSATTSCSISIRAHGTDVVVTDTFACSGSSGQQANRTPSLLFSGSDMTSRIINADIRISITYANGTTQTSSWTTTSLKLIRERIAPVVTIALSDSTSAYSDQGAYVQGVSRIAGTVSAVLDTEADSDITTSVQTLIVANNHYTLNTNNLIIETDAYSGTINYQVSVTDSYGITGTTTGSFDVMAYTAPSMSQVKFERYVMKDLPDGSTIPVASDDGDHVRVSLVGRVSQLTANAWTVKAEYNGSVDPITMASGDNGQNIVLLEDRNAFPDELASQYSWAIDVTIADAYRSTVYTVTVVKAGGIFSIEKGGVAIGKRCTATEDSPEFQCAYPAHFDAGIYDANGNAISKYSDDYTTSAVAIGKFLGKTLYRKVKSFSTYSADSSSPTTMNMNISPTMIVRLDGFVKTTSYGMIPINCYHSSSIRSFCRPDKLTGNFIGYAGCANSGAVLIIEYTKD